MQKKSIIKKMNLRTFNIQNSGLNYNVKLSDSSLTNFEKLAGYIAEKFWRDNVKRYTVALAGPPGCGKSTLATILTYILQNKYKVPARVLPLDGFHFNNRYLKENYLNIKGKVYTLYELKGAPQTFDTKKYFNYLKRLTESEDTFHWPAYSRIKHEPEEKGIFIDNKRTVYIIEGNYLLLKEVPWSSHISYYRDKLFIKPLRFILRYRVVNRKVAGGYSRKYARHHYRLVDKINIQKVIKDSFGWDILIRQILLYRYRIFYKSTVKSP